ncbi:MAG: hypothetical protein ACYSUQ_09885 [Planctomycetota bacterium]
MLRQVTRCWPSRKAVVSHRRATRVLATLVVVSAGPGCAPRTTRFFIQDHRGEGSPRKYYEKFDDCYYCRDAHGNVDIVARRRSPVEGSADHPLTQVLHIHQVWAAVPGRTSAEESMINATVSYLIVSPDSGASFEGGGFVTFSENRKGTEIAGRLESSALTPQRRLGSGADIFDQASVTGTFRARRDKRQVVRLLNEMKRLFGPMPRYEPPPVNPDLR